MCRLVDGDKGIVDLNAGKDLFGAVGAVSEKVGTLSTAKNENATVWQQFQCGVGAGELQAAEFLPFAIEAIVVKHPRNRIALGGVNVLFRGSGHASDNQQFAGRKRNHAPMREWLWGGTASDIAPEVVMREQALSLPHVFPKERSTRSRPHP